MHFSQKTEPTIGGVSITRDEERVFYALISIDTHTQTKDVHREALAHVYTDALLTGCGSYTKQEFLDAVNILGASITVSIQNDILTFGLQCLDTNKTKLLQLFSLMVEKPTFAPAQIRKTILVLANELEETQEDAKMRSFVAFTNTLYAKQDRRYTSLGAELIMEVAKITQKDLRTFHKEVLEKKWVYTFCSSSAERSKTITFFEKLRAKFEVTPAEVFSDEKVSLTQPKVVLTAIPSRQNIELAIGAPLQLTLTDPAYHAFVFGLNVLGKWGGFAGRLMSTVREKEGLTYGIYAQTEAISKTEEGHWRIMTFFSPEKVIEGINSTLFQVNLIREKGITKSEFTRFMQIIETQETLLQDSLIKNVQHIHSFLLRDFSLTEIEAFKKQRKLVTHKEVNSALKKYLTLSNLVISGAGPTASKEKELSALAKTKK